MQAHWGPQVFDAGKSIDGEEDSPGCQEGVLLGRKEGAPFPIQTNWLRELHERSLSVPVPEGEPRLVVLQLLPPRVPRFRDRTMQNHI